MDPHVTTHAIRWLSTKMQVVHILRLQEVFRMQKLQSKQRHSQGVCRQRWSRGQKTSSTKPRPLEKMKGLSNVDGAQRRPNVLEVKRREGKYPEEVGDNHSKPILIPYVRFFFPNHAITPRRLSLADYYDYLVRMGKDGTITSLGFLAFRPSTSLPPYPHPVWALHDLVHMPDLP